MDIVICVALKDCCFLKKNLYFIKKNLKPNHIWIITDKRNFKYLPHTDYLISLIDENSLIENLTFDRVKNLINKYLHIRLYGWYYQQFLKLGFALSKYAKEEYLVWDSDTVPLKEIQIKDEEGSDLILPKEEHHQPYFDTIDRLFNAEKKANYSFISEHMVFNVEIVKEMLSTIENNSNENFDWIEQCISVITKGELQGFSEFETYGTYCLNYYPEKHKVRIFPTFRFGSRIYGIFATIKEIESLAFDCTTVSFELFDYPIATFRRLKQVLYSFLCRSIAKYRTIKG